MKKQKLRCVLLLLTCQMLLILAELIAILNRQFHSEPWNSPQNQLIIEMYWSILMMNKLIKWPLLPKQVQSHPMIQSTINLGKIKRNKLYQSNRSTIRHINTRERKLTSMGKEKGYLSNLIQPISKAQAKTPVKSRNQQQEIRSMCSE